MGPWAAGFFRTEARVGTDQYVEPSIVSDTTARPSISRPVFASFTVSPDHHTKSATVAGPWLAK